MGEPENSRYASVVLFITGFSSYFLIGFHFTTLGPLVPTLQDLYNQTYTDESNTRTMLMFAQEFKVNTSKARYGVPLPNDLWFALLTLTISFVLIGGFIGGCSNKFLLSVLSRKRIIQLCHCFNLVGIAVICLIGGLTRSYEAIIVGRLLVGIPLGVFFTLIAMFNAEMSAKGRLHIWQSITAMSLLVSSVFGPALTHPKGLGTTELWSVGVSFAALPSILYLAAAFRFPLSPYYLIRTGKVDEAFQVLRKLRTGNENDIQAEIASMEKEINQSTNVLTLKETLSTSHHRRIFFAVVALFAGSILSGAGHFLYYTDFVFLQAGVNADSVTFATIGVFGIQCLLGLPAFKIIGRFGGVKVLIASTVSVLFSLILFTVSQITFRFAPTVMPIIAIVATALIICSFGSFLTPALLVVLSEITTEPIRPTAFGYGSMALWFFAWLVGFLPPYLQESFGPYSVTPWLGCTIFFLIFQLTCLPETKGKTCKQIQDYFA